MKRVLAALFLGAEGALYIAFLFRDLTGQYSTNLKYFSIILCLWAVAPLFDRGAKLPSLFTAAAFMLTLVADTFLLFMDKYYLVGVLCFCCVQGLYAWELYRRTGRWLPAARFGLLAAALGAVWLLDVLDPLTAASMLSFTLLTVNALLAMIEAGNGKGGKLLAAGLTLFWCCDACVGLHNLLAYVPKSPLAAVVPLASFGMWLFYLPAQVLLVLYAWERASDLLEKRQRFF